MFLGLQIRNFDHYSKYGLIYNKPLMQTEYGGYERDEGGERHGYNQNEWNRKVATWFYSAVVYIFCFSAIFFFECSDLKDFNFA